MKRYGIIDIGSNTEVLVIYEYDDAQFSLLRYISVPVHLIRYHENGHMRTEGIRKTEETVQSFLDVCAGFGVTDVYAGITEPWRNIDNADELVSAIERLGVRVTCLSGRQEAECDLYAARMAFDDVGLLIDIGGGSTEFVSAKGDDVQAIVSIPYGCLRLESMHADAAACTDILKQMRRENPLLQDSPVLTGVGGTIRSIDAFMRKYTGCANGIPVEKLYEVYELAAAGDPEIMELIWSSITEDRKPFIIPGLGMAVSACRVFGASTLRFSPYSVREGFFFRHVLHR